MNSLQGVGAINPNICEWKHWPNLSEYYSCPSDIAWGYLILDCTTRSASGRDHWVTGWCGGHLAGSLAGGDLVAIQGQMWPTAGHHFNRLPIGHRVGVCQLTWISMCLGLSMNFSMRRRSSPKLDAASCEEKRKPSLWDSGHQWDSETLLRLKGKKRPET